MTNDGRIIRRSSFCQLARDRLGKRAARTASSSSSRTARTISCRARKSRISASTRTSCARECSGGSVPEILAAFSKPRKPPTYRRLAAAVRYCFAIRNSSGLGWLTVSGLLRDARVILAPIDLPCGCPSHAAISASLIAKAHDRVPVNAGDPFRRTDRHALSEGGYDLDLLVARERIHDRAQSVLWDGLPFWKSRSPKRIFQ